MTENFALERGVSLLSTTSLRLKAYKPFPTLTQLPSVPWRGHPGQQLLYLVYQDHDQNRTYMITRFGVYYRYQLF